MTSNIPIDKQRFNDIINGKVRRNLQDLINRGGIVGRKGNDKVVIPIPNINLPRFKYGDKDGEGEGEGEGEGGKAGEESGEHQLEIGIEELAQIMGEELGLPKIEPRGKRTLVQEFDHYAGLRKRGPRGLLRVKRTYLEAIKRQVSSGEYDPDEYDDDDIEDETAPLVQIIKDDMRFRSWKTKDVPESSAVVMYLMDVSGSMTERHKGIARRISFWTDLWLRSHYRGLESVYIIHDSEAHEVDYNTFYHTTMSGGTKIASSYKLAKQIIEARYNPLDWNIYLFQYSDGDNWGDNKEEFDVLENHILPAANLLCYAQIDIPWWSGTQYANKFSNEDSAGKYLTDLKQFAADSEFEDKVLTSKLTGEEGIMETIKGFLRTGK